jgi:hypothetical protein
MLRRPIFRMRAVQYTCSPLAGARNAVFSSEVSASLSTPMRALIASHIAQSAAAISAGPLMMPPGRSSAALCGSSSVHRALLTETTLKA